LDNNDQFEEVLKLKFNEQKIVGMYCGDHYICLLVENEKKEKQVVSWGDDEL
jgi:hypothetical protein